MVSKVVEVLTTLNFDTIVMPVAVAARMVATIGSIQLLLSVKYTVVSLNLSRPLE